MSLPTSDLAFMLQDAGTRCSVSGSGATFYGIYNADTRIEQDETGNDVVLVGTSVIVDTTTANTLPKNSYIYVNAVRHQVRDKMLMGDGALTQLVVAKG